MKVLITGATGFVGSHLRSYLWINTDWDINFVRSGDEIPDRHFDVIINLASISSVQESVTNPEKVITNNIDCLLNVLKIARNNKMPSLFVHLSTIEAGAVSNPYSASKAAQEKIINAYRLTYNLPIVILRSTNIVGPHQSTEKFVPKIVEQIRSGEPISLFDGKRVYNTVINVCDAIKFCIDNVSSHGKIWEIDGGSLVTNEQMVAKVAKLLNKNYEIKNDSRQAYIPEIPTNRMKSLSSLGWKPPQKLDEGLSWIK